jgi:hypothetical protein
LTDQIVGPDAGCWSSVVRRHALDAESRPQTPADARRGPELCVMCGVPAVVERRCKVICTHCGTILQSCADL